MSETRELIGPKPEPTPGPRFEFPFHSNGEVVRDANNKVIISSEYGETLSEDREIAVAVASALNVKYEPTNVMAETPAPPFQGRVLIHRTGRLLDFPNGMDAPFAYEVSPGKFWWAKDRDEAMHETQGLVHRGWPAVSSDQLYDVTDPFGEQVITG